MKKLAQKVANAQDAAAKEAAFSWRLGRGGKRISFAAMQPYLKLKRKTASAKAGASRYRTFKRLREKALGLIQRALPRSRKPPAQ
ncbi:MAG TPA: hypothetical protein VJH23_00800 [archaeon]|nr:hypothetical protein [archaeon]